MAEDDDATTGQAGGDLENQATEETHLLLGKTNVAHLEDRLLDRIKIFRTAYTMNQATYVTLAVMSLALTSTVAVIQAVPNNHRILVAALGAGSTQRATVVTGFMTYAKLEIEMKEQEDALLETQSLLENLRQLTKRSGKYKKAADTATEEEKRLKAIGKICQTFTEVRQRTSTPSWLVSIGRASENDPDAETRDEYVYDCCCCSATYASHKKNDDADDLLIGPEWTSVKCCFCFTMEKRERTIKEDDEDESRKNSRGKRNPGKNSTGEDDDDDGANNKDEKEDMDLITTASR